MDDIYVDLKNLVEKAHTVLVLEQNTKQTNPQTSYQIKPYPTNHQTIYPTSIQTALQNIKQTNQNIKLKIQKTQASQTITTKPTKPQTHIYVSLPPAGRRGTRTDTSIINWSHSLRRRSYFF